MTTTDPHQPAHDPNEPPKPPPAPEGEPAPPAAPEESGDSPNYDLPNADDDAGAPPLREGGYLAGDSDEEY